MENRAQRIKPVADTDRHRLVRMLQTNPKHASRGKIVDEGKCAQNYISLATANDALIERTASLNNCFVVTHKLHDFDRFLPYMKGLVILPADDFFD